MNNWKKWKEKNKKYNPSQNTSRVARFLEITFFLNNTKKTNTTKTKAASCFMLGNDPHKKPAKFFEVK